MAWQLLIDDNFQRPDTTPGSAGSTTGVGNGWIDFLGNTWQIKNNQATCVDPTGSYTEYLRYLVRPEISLNQRIVFDYQPASANQHLFLRLNTSANNFYDLQLSTPSSNNVSVLMNVFLNGNFNGTIVSSGFSYIQQSQYQIECSLIGANLTAISLNVSNATANTTMLAHSLSDSVGLLQTEGTLGLSFYQGPSYFSRVAYYTVATAIPRGVGFFGAVPVPQQLGGAATAGTSYSDNERVMIQKMYNALRNYGLLS